MPRVAGRAEWRWEGERVEVSVVPEFSRQRGSWVDVECSGGEGHSSIEIVIVHQFSSPASLAQRLAR